MDIISLIKHKDNFFYMIETLYKNVPQIEKRIRSFKREKKNILDYRHNFDSSVFTSTKDFCIWFRQIVLKMMNDQTHIEKLENIEIAHQVTKIKYRIVIGDTPEKIKLFCLYLLVYELEAYERKHFSKKWKSHVGIDYEYFNQDIALMQINFETYASIKEETISYIWLIHPKELDDKQHALCVSYFITSPYIYKLVHGADPLDMPVTYKFWCHEDKAIFTKYIRNVTDLRFLCEYYVSYDQGQTDKPMKHRCSIYQAMLASETITEEKYKELDEIEKKMGPNQDRYWDIHKLSSYHILYAFYDVIFLKHLMQRMRLTAKKTHSNIYPSLIYITYLTRFIYAESEKYGLSSIYSEAKVIIDPMNNYLIKYHDKNFTLMAIFTDILKDLHLSNGTDVNSLFGVNYFRTNLKLIFKLIVYSVIGKHNQIWKNRNQPLNKNLYPDLNLLYHPIEKLYKNLLPFFQDFQRSIENKLKNLYL